MIDSQLYRGAFPPDDSIDVLVDAPGDLKGDVAIAGKQVEYLVLLAKGE